MPGPLKRPQQFKRGRDLPGQTSDEDLGLDTSIRIYGGPSYTIIEKDLVRIGDVGAGRFIEVDPNGIKLYNDSVLLLELNTDGEIIVGPAASEHVKIDSSSLQLKDGSTVYTELTDEELTLGKSSTEHIEISPTSIQLKGGSTVYTDLTAGALSLGRTSQDHVEIDSTGIELKDGSVVRGQWQTDGDMLLGSDISDPDTTNFVIFAGAQTYNGESMGAGDMLIGDNSAGEANIRWAKAAGRLLFRTGQTTQAYIDSDTILIGDISSEHITIDSNGLKIYDSDGSTVKLALQGDLELGNTSADHVKVSSAGVEMKDGSVVRGQWQTDGDMLLGSDISDPATTYITIFASPQTYNSESMAAGDMLIGDNSASKANILWDKSEGRLLFRGGQDTKAYIDTDGAITAGAGDVILDDDGLALAAGTGTPNQLKITDETDVIFKLYSQVDSGTSQLQLVSQGKDSSNHEAYLQFQVITDDGSAHVGAAQLYLTLDTAQDTCVISAEQLRGFKICRLTGITTTERNALSPVDGMIIYNTTTSKFQGRAGGSWVDFH